MKTLPPIPKTIVPYKTYQQRFEWRFQAKEFVSEIKRRSKQKGLKVEIGILPSYKFQTYGHNVESRISIYYVRWYFFPNDSTWLNRFLYAPSL